MMDFGHDRLRDSRTRGIGFQTATAATTTKTPVGLDGHMTNLARGASQPCINSAILDNAGPDAGPHEDTDKVAIALPCPMNVLAQGRNLYIVAQRNRLTKLLVENAAQRHIAHPEVGRIQHYSRLAVNLTGSSHANRDQTVLGRQVGGIEGRHRQFRDALRDEVLPTLGA